MAFPLVTKTLHSKTYPSIDPTLPALSTANRTVLITGGGRGLGPILASSFAAAGSTKIAILGRTAATLDSTVSNLLAKYPNITVLPLVADVTNEAQVAAAFAETKKVLGPIDILVSNAAYMPFPAPVASAPVADWWNSMEINVKGNLHLMQAFVANMNTATEPIIVNITTGGTHLSPLPTLSGYVVGKLAALKMFEYFAAENPGIRVMNVHPGVMETDMGDKGREGGMVLPYDDSEFKHALMILIVHETLTWLDSVSSRWIYCMGS